MTKLKERRRSFCLQFKLAALKHLDESKNVTKTAKYFDIHRDSLRNWRDNKTEIERAHFKSE